MSVSGPGPSSAADLRRWPLTVLDRLTQRNDGSDGERLHRLESHFRRGLCVYSDYSGISGEHEIFWQMTHALQQRSMYASMDSVQLTRVCDFGSVQQNVLMQLSALEPEGFCVMQDINDRLPPVARQVLDAAMPPRDADVVTAAAAYKDMASYLMDNRQWVYTDAFSQCLAHSRRCRLFRRIDDSPAQELDADSQPSPSKRPRVEGPRKLRINFAGTTCKGWSMAGKQLQFSDVSERPHAVWITERFRRAEVAEEDLFFSECTPKYPVQAPLAWLGPPEDQVQADFYKFFQATLQLTGDEVYAEQTRLAKLRGHFLPETPAAVQKHQVYSPGQLVRLQAYDKMRLCKFDPVDDKKNKGKKPCFICTKLAMKGKRWKKLICWTQFKKSYVNARTERSRNGSKPFEFKQWVRRCVNEMGWLWIPIIEESHSDRDRTKLNVIEESSAAEKDLSDADRHILFSHCNSSIDAPKDDFFFQAKDEPVSPSGPEETPQKRKASEAQASGISEVSPQEKRARLKIARVSSGPAFSTFRVSSAEKIQSVVQSKVQVLTLAVSNGTECVSMQEFTEQADDSVLQSYRSMLSHAMEVAQAWLAEPKDLKDPETFSDGLPEGVASANLAVSTQLESAGAHVKLVQGGASLHSLAYWRWMFKKVMICEEAAVIAEQMDVFKDDMQVFEQFRKGLAKICSDVKSYLTQKDKSKIKEEQKRLKAAQKQEAQAQKAHAKKEA
ncbi:unnamed protein product, partial [Effrenium voratum]